MQGDPAVHMASTAATSGPRAKCDQVVFEALSKATEIIVSSRGGGANGLHPQQHQPHPAQRQQNFGVPYRPNVDTTPVSSRFNLTLPENTALRSILQKWRRALHLPIRLDVYFEHEDNRRELLERWCLEYVMGDAFWRDQHNNALLSNESTDPIVQLRHVCKKIVIWLRTLYCFARLMPSAAFLNTSNNNLNQKPFSSSSPIGFSLYAVSEDSADIAQLKEQGFLYQRQPASAVTTPYGELSWQVLYAPGDTVHRLAPRRNTTEAGNLLRPPPTTSHAIPISNGRLEDDSKHPNHLSNHFDNVFPPNHPAAEERMMMQGGIPQSAPAHMHHHLSKERARTDLWQNNGHHGAIPQQNTFNPRLFTNRDRRSTMDDPRQQNLQQRLIPPHVLQRRHTSGQEMMEGENGANNNTLKNSEKGDPPQRVRSGLSLALMMSDENNEATSSRRDGDHTTNHNRDSAAEKRRAALHQMPPHLQQSSPATRSISNEYGYAYNNHIPLEKLRAESGGSISAVPPSDTLPTATPEAIGHQSSPIPPTAASPLLGTTPPSGVFLGTMDPYVTPPPQIPSLANLLPPRNPAAATIAPPFASRPPGFSQDRPIVPSPGGVAKQQQVDRQEPNPQQEIVDIPQLTSLDMLHHSPFGPGGSMLSSLSGGPAVFGSEAASLFYNSGSVDFRNSSGGGMNITIPNEEYEEMPFAVDQSTSENPPLVSSSATPGTSSHLLASSAAVASFAQKCSMQQKLEMFDRPSKQLDGTEEGKRSIDQDIGQLADQLADFRSFGESLRLSGAVSAKSFTPTAEVETAPTSSPSMSQRK